MVKLPQNVNSFQQELIGSPTIFSAMSKTCIVTHHPSSILEGCVPVPPFSLPTPGYLSPVIETELYYPMEVEYSKHVCMLTCCSALSLLAEPVSESHGVEFAKGCAVCGSVARSCEA